VAKQPNVGGSVVRKDRLCVIVPTDGTSAATGGNGDFGTSPIFGQLSDKPLLVVANMWGARRKAQEAVIAPLDECGRLE
jgi:hypothetical protein